jgi:hypothetical protein
MKTELEKAWRAVEVAEMIMTGLRNAILERQLYATSLEGAASTYEERYCMNIAKQNLQLAQSAYFKLRALTDCSTSGLERPDQK